MNQGLAATAIDINLSLKEDFVLILPIKTLERAAFYFKKERVDGVDYKTNCTVRKHESFFLLSPKGFSELSNSRTTHNSKVHYYTSTWHCFSCYKRCLAICMNL